MATLPTPRNDAFAGGTRTPAANPVAVGGTYGSPGAAAAPPNVPTPQILSARNNSGTNVRIPYARLVPMRATTKADAYNWPAIPGVGGALGGRPMPGQEYDGLEGGELAWILGRRHNDVGGTDVNSIRASAHGMGLGYGPDRMQRLAYTAWVEAFFRARFGTNIIPLHTMHVVSENNNSICDEIDKNQAFLAGCTPLGTMDIPHFVNARYALKTFADGKNSAQLYYTGNLNEINSPNDYNPATFDMGTGAKTSTVENPAIVAADGYGRFTVDAHEEGLACGLFVLETGPFLRGKVINDDAVSMIAPGQKATGSLGSKEVYHHVPRNLGDKLAFEALYAQMRRMSFFDWSPDGVVLSKLESPSGEPLSSAELDARQAQLFNVAVQGPAIAKTWTGDPKMQCMPMDKVFVVIVADVSTTVATDRKAGAGPGPDKALGAYKNFLDALHNNQDTTGLNKLKETFENAVKTANLNLEAKGPYEPNIVPNKVPDSHPKLVTELFKKQAEAVAAPTDAGKQRALSEAEAKLTAHFGPIDATTFKKNATGVKQGTTGIESCTMTNFRLMRCTSSFLAQYSGTKFVGQGTMKTVNSASRCGLRLGEQPGTSGTYHAEYIIGGWCIGTVMDSAASRSTVGHLVRIAPASMALNISVNIEWWSGDDLYKRYMDVAETVTSRGQMPSSSADRNANAHGVDVPPADLEEALSFVPSNSS